MTKNCQKRITQSRFTKFFVLVWYILDASRWILTSRRFRICVAKGGRGCFRLSYGRPKLTLFSKKKSTKMSRRKKQARPQFSKYRFQNESAWAHSLWPHADSIWSRYFEICGRACFFLRLIILLTDPILSHSPNFGRPKQGQKFVVPTFHIHILNPECVRIPWVLAPKNFPVQNFRVRSVLQKSSIFHWFLLPPPKKKYRARVPTILMPQTFPIASLNRYTPNFSGVPQKLT